MCRRFSMSAGIDEIGKHFEINRVMYFYKNRYNISPTQSVPVILHDQGERVLDEYRWGLVPYWGKDAVNADLSAVDQNPTYRKAVDLRRCVIPCNGFYYWRTVGKKSYAVRVVMPNNELFGVAGLYETWRNAKGEKMRTCTMLMTGANVFIREFEERMPAILSTESMETWLNPECKGFNNLQPLLRSYDGSMRIYPVTPLVANDNHDHHQCIEEMDLKLAWVKNL
ncbi:Putative SOS response-associated peptidase YedK [Paenibacillus uliginis N3/975]|uniref:Abasic site processing protein n=1 Tax=Paenibacillus uliginis N3/975 TaxID=1313296 RepID=A0A1X7HU34_9BACL|nr:SOS response-associated peptidase [Paenibacillus uliginis]SMF92821.1 Putative SOS response-associated peptidase YedK [Paenibacillus uliginis N3/975]